MALNLKEFISTLEVKAPLSSDNLIIFPLVCPQQAPSPTGEPFSYLLLEEALASSSFEIGEVNEAGDVNTVVITNLTGLPVLILDGEEILGAKQNRMVNATTLVAAGLKTHVPVSCVERGRWRFVSEKFDRSGSFGYSTLRRQKSEQVYFSLCANQTYSADQGAIWNEIDRKQATMGSRSDTDALHDVYDNLEDEIAIIVSTLKSTPGQCGHLVFINNRFACLDLFDQPDTLQKLWPKLVKSYAVEGLEAKREKADSGQPDPAAILSAIADSDCIAYPSVGLGRDLRLTGGGIIGAGLAVDDRIVHLSIFEKVEEGSDTNQGRIFRPAYRRRNLD